MNPGELKTKINFYKSESITDEDGFKTKTLTNIFSTKCKIQKIQTTDNNRSGSENLNSFTTLVYCALRYNKNINDKCVVELDGKKYKIKSFSNVNFENKILELILQND